MAGFTTTIVHSDRRNPIEHGSLHKPIHSNVAYGYDDARELADVFQGRKKGYSYGRQINPTVEALEHKITQMENGVATVCFTTGMARDRNDVVRAAARRRSFRLERVSVRQYQQPLCELRQSRRRRHVRRCNVGRRGCSGNSAEHATRVRRNDRESTHAGGRSRSDRRVVSIQGSRLRRRQHDDVAVPVSAEHGRRQHRRQCADEIHCGSRQRARRQFDGARSLRLADALRTSRRNIAPAIRNCGV